LFRDAGLSPTGVTITAGAGDSLVADTIDQWLVSKATLIGGLQVAYQTDRLKVVQGIGRGPAGDGEDLTALLTRELSSFKMRRPSISENSAEAWRDGPQDLVFALGMAAWHAEKNIPLPKGANDAWTRKIEENRGKGMSWVV